MDTTSWSQSWSWRAARIVRTPSDDKRILKLKSLQEEEEEGEKGEKGGEKETYVMCKYHTGISYRTQHHTTHGSSLSLSSHSSPAHHVI